MWKHSKHYSRPSCTAGKYYSSRNNPHPKVVYHMPGLNNGLVCVVSSSFPGRAPYASNAAIPKEEADVLTGNATRNSSASHSVLDLKDSMQREQSPSQSLTRRAGIPERTRSNSTSSEQLLKKRFQASEQPANRHRIQGAPLTQPPSVSLHYDPHIQENLSGLNRDIKVLENLGKVLQTDSLSEIQKWYATASKKEKASVSNLIYSEPTDKGTLNSSKECRAEKMNTQSFLKLHAPLQRGPQEETYQSRTLSKESVTRQNIKQEMENERLLLSTLRNRRRAQADPLFPAKTCN